MIKIKKHIEIVSSTKRFLSSMGVESRKAAQATLAQHYTRVGITIINSESDLEKLVSLQPDLVFLGMDFMYTDDTSDSAHPNKIWMSDYLDQHGIAYTGSSRIAHEREHDKHLAKQRVMDIGLDTAPFLLIKQDSAHNIDICGLNFPLFIKPTNRGGGVGIDSNSVVYNYEQLRAQAQSISAKFQSDSLVEEYLPGREFSVAILKDIYSDEYDVMPIELIPPKDKNGIRMLSKLVKSSIPLKAIEVLDIDTQNSLKTLALGVFYALDAQDYGRIDIRMDSVDTPYFLEANLIPSLVEDYGSFPKACKLNINLSYESMILQIVELGFRRNINLIEEIEEIPSFNTAVSSLVPVL